MQSDGGFDDQPAARQRYEKALIQLGHDEAQWETLGLKNLSIGWAIGTDGWKKSLAKELRQTALEPGLHRTEVRELREHAWDDAVKSALNTVGRTEDDVANLPLGQDWKLAIAIKVRGRTGAPWTWLAERLNLGPVGTLRSRLCRQRKSSVVVQHATA